MFPTVSIQIVTWNSMKYLPDLLASIMEQTFQDFNVLLIDNGSTDGMESFVRNQYPQVAVIRNARHIGIGASRNQGIRYALEHGDGENKNRFILLLAPEILLTPSVLENLLSAAQAHAEAGSFTGKLLNSYTQHFSDEVLKETQHSNRIESAGLQAHRNGHMSLRHHGILDEGEHDELQPVFGAPALFAFYRAQALEDTKWKEEYMDPDLSSTMQGVDLAWRLQHQGLDCFYVSAACAYISSGTQNAPLKKETHSFGDHLIVLVKNIEFMQALRHFPWIISAELRCALRRLVYGQDPNFGVKRESSVYILLKKRKTILSTKKRLGKEIRKWFI